MASPKKQSQPSATPASAYTTIDVAERNDVALITLNRPDVHNAFDETMIAELTQALRTLDESPSTRAVVLLAAGESFCAGADLGWMKRMAGFAHEQNLEDARALARLLETLASLSKPTIARVHGPAYGGGVGLIACCDIAIASPEAVFALSEAKLGLIPATISPYVIQAIGARHARRFMLTGEKFEAAEAYRIGLVHDLAQFVDLDARINELLGKILLCGPQAQREIKVLVRDIAGRTIDEELIADTAGRIAAVRATDEGREGVAAFLERRSPAWVPASLRTTRKKK